MICFSRSLKVYKQEHFLKFYCFTIPTKPDEIHSNKCLLYLDMVLILYWIVQAFTHIDFESNTKGILYWSMLNVLITPSVNKLFFRAHQKVSIRKI